VSQADLVDRPAERPVTDVVRRYRGMKWDVVTETVALDPQTSVQRDVVVHPGAVGIAALDDSGRILLLRQYRHPVQSELWELPAGLLDVAGEDAVLAAQRELFEEAHLRASRWDVLIDVFSSPGMCSEAYRVFLARDLSVVPDEQRHVATDEERDMPMLWVPVDDAVRAATDGRIHNAMAVVSVFAVAHARDHDWTTLRTADAPWPQRNDRYHRGDAPDVTAG
jgi:8-oxo-dGTP pyrophosphatase MutT (NUDIX family)